MLADISSVDAIYIVCGRTDMRKSIDGLLELLAPWNETVKAEIERRANESNQSYVNCQGGAVALKDWCAASSLCKKLQPGFRKV